MFVARLHCERAIVRRADCRILVLTRQAALIPGIGPDDGVVAYVTCLSCGAANALRFEFVDERLLAVIDADVHELVDSWESLPAVIMGLMLSGT